jgi:hypothetical protein
MQASDLLRKMGDALGNTNSVGRFPDLEQDAMRYWVNREFIAGIAGITVERLDEMTDKHIQKILSGQ